MLGITWRNRIFVISWNIRDLLIKGGLADLEVSAFHHFWGPLVHFIFHNFYYWNITLMVEVGVRGTVQFSVLWPQKSKNIYITIHVHICISFFLYARVCIQTFSFVKASGHSFDWIDSKFLGIQILLLKPEADRSFVTFWIDASLNSTSPSHLISIKCCKRSSPMVERILVLIKLYLGERSFSRCRGSR